MDEFIPVKRLNHVALKVRDLDASVDFYTRVMGFTEDVGRFGNDVIAFLRAPGSTNHHDLALLKIGPKASDASAGPSACSTARGRSTTSATSSPRATGSSRKAASRARPITGRPRPSTAPTPTATRSRSPGSCPATNGARGRPTHRSRRRSTSTTSSPTEAESAISAPGIWSTTSSADEG